MTHQSTTDQAQASGGLFGNVSRHSPFLTDEGNGEPPAKKQKIDNEQHSIDVCSDAPGDLIIRVGKDDSLLLRVHSGVLKLASPVFRKMLGAQWREGNTIYTADDPLHLEDDDPTAFTDLCKLLHHQTDSQSRVPLSRFRGLTKLADKYSCCHLLRSMLKELTGRLFKNELVSEHTLYDSKDISIQDLICVAYVVGDGDTFTKATKHALVCCDVLSFATLTHSDVLELMPETYLGMSKSTLK